MLNIVKVFENGTVLFFDEGQFDEYSVYQLNEGEKQFAPRDKKYFDFLKTLADKYGAAYVYKDFVNIYNRTNKVIDDGVLHLISDIASNRYRDEKVTVDIQFTILYMTMLADENKKYTKLGKRIQRLGVHVLLFENKSSEEAADFLRGIPWREIDKMCRERGF